MSHYFSCSSQRRPPSLTDNKTYLPPNFFLHATTGLGPIVVLLETSLLFGYYSFSHKVFPSFGSSKGSNFSSGISKSFLLKALLLTHLTPPLKINFLTVENVARVLGILVCKNRWNCVWYLFHSPQALPETILQSPVPSSPTPFFLPFCLSHGSRRGGRRL